MGMDGRARWAGVRTCGYVWECPRCRATQLREPSTRIVGAVAAHRDAGGASYLLTLTLRRPTWGARGHERAPSARESVRRWLEAWEAFRHRRAVKSLLGGLPWARALEITAGPSGDWADTLWHAHGHVLVLAPQAMSEGELEAWRAALAYEWREAVSSTAWDARWLPMLSNIGLDARPCEAADYLSKLGLELVGRGKQGRTDGRVSCWELLALTGDRRKFGELQIRWAVRSWLEYVAATRGANERGRSLASLQTSRSMRELMRAVKLEEADEGTEILFVSPRDYRTLAARTSWLVKALEAAERGEDVIEALCQARVPRSVTDALRARDMAHRRAREAVAEMHAAPLPGGTLALALLG